MRRPIYNFAIDPELLAALREVKARDGISESEQIRRGIRLWLRTKGIPTPKSGLKDRRARARKP